MKVVLKFVFFIPLIWELLLVGSFQVYSKGQTPQLILIFFILIALLIQAFHQHNHLLLTQIQCLCLILLPKVGILAFSGVSTHFTQLLTTLSLIYTLKVPELLIQGYQGALLIDKLLFLPLLDLPLFPNIFDIPIFSALPFFITKS